MPHDFRERVLLADVSRSNANHGEDLFVQRAVLSIERIIDTNIATIRQNVGHVNPKNGGRPFAQLDKLTLRWGYRILFVEYLVAVFISKKSWVQKLSKVLVQLLAVPNQQITRTAMHIALPGHRRKDDIGIGAS